MLATDIVQDVLVQGGRWMAHGQGEEDCQTQIRAQYPNTAAAEPDSVCPTHTPTNITTTTILVLCSTPD